LLTFRSLPPLPPKASRKRPPSCGAKPVRRVFHTGESGSPPGAHIAPEASETCGGRSPARNTLFPKTMPANLSPSSMFSQSTPFLLRRIEPGVPHPNVATKYPLP